MIIIIILFLFLYYFFCECHVTVDLWNELRLFFAPSINLDPLTPKSAMLGFLEVNDDTFLLKNHILLLFKLCVYQNRSDTPTIHTIIREIKVTYEIEKNINSNRVESRKIREKMVYTHPSARLVIIVYFEMQ